MFYIQGRKTNYNDQNQLNFTKFSFSHIFKAFFLLNNINLDSLLSDSRNRLIMVDVQNFIFQANPFI